MLCQRCSALHRFEIHTGMSGTTIIRDNIQTVSSRASTSCLNSSSWSSGASKKLPISATNHFLFCSHLHFLYKYSWLRLVRIHCGKESRFWVSRQADICVHVHQFSGVIEVKNTTYGRQNTWPQKIACRVSSIESHVYASRQTSQQLEVCRISIHTA